MLKINILKKSKYSCGIRRDEQKKFPRSRISCVELCAVYQAAMGQD